MRAFYFSLILAFCASIGCGGGGSGGETATPEPEISQIYFPPSNSDEWLAESDGFDQTGLEEVTEFAANNDTTALIVLKEGKIVLEQYWQGWDKHTSDRIFSASKSVVSVLIGIAQENGYLDIDDAVSEHLGTGWSAANPNNEILITIRHLLTMSSGLNLQLEKIANPGESWFYNSNAYYKLFEVIEKASGYSRVDFTKLFLFDVIGMGDSSYPVGNLSVRVSSSARDMARFGWFMLNNGDWESQSVIADKSYLQQSLEPSQEFNPAYGFLWWLNGEASYIHPATDESVDGDIFPGTSSSGYAALGFADKIIYMDPESDIVIVRQGNSAVQDPVSFDFAGQLIDGVLSAQIQ